MKFIKVKAFEGTSPGRNKINYIAISETVEEESEKEIGITLFINSDLIGAITERGEAIIKGNGIIELDSISFNRFVLSSNKFLEMIESDN